MADSQEITTTRTPMEQWRITGSDGGHAATITAYKGEHIELSTSYLTTLSGALAGEIGTGLLEAAIFVSEDEAAA